MERGSLIIKNTNRILLGKTELRKMLMINEYTRYILKNVNNSKHELENCLDLRKII